MRKQVYRDVTDDHDAAERFCPLDALGASLRGHGLRELFRMEGIGTFTDAPTVLRTQWLVFATDDGATSVSTQILQGRASHYAASQLTNGTIIETNPWPTLGLWWSLGPFATARDRHSGRVQRWAPNDLPSILEMHRAALSEEAARAGSDPRPWTVQTYLAFRRASYHLIWANVGAAAVVAVWLTGLALFGLLTAFGVLVPRWPVWLIGILSFLLATFLIGWRVAVWLARGVVKRMPLATRIRLATAWDGSDDD